MKYKDTLVTLDDFETALSKSLAQRPHMFMEPAVKEFGIRLNQHNPIDGASWGAWMANAKIIESDEIVVVHPSLFYSELAAKRFLHRIRDMTGKRVRFTQ